MLVCTHCGRDDFKKPQGLSGHIRMVHNGTEQPAQEIQELPEPRTEEVIQEMVRQIATIATDAVETKILEMDQESPAHLTAEEFQQAIHVEIVKLGQVLRENLVPHPCHEPECQICKPVIADIRRQTIDKIEERLPGTWEGLQNYDLLHTVIG